MRLSLECAVDANIRIAQDVTVTRGETEYVLTADDGGNLTAIKIVATIPADEQAACTLEPGDGRVAVRVKLKLPPKTYDMLVSEFQELESLISFAHAGQLRRIRWNEPTIVLVPETPDEETRVNVAGLSTSSYYRIEPETLSRDDFERLLASRGVLSNLTVVKSFYREGVREFEQARYVSAFYNFYFVLEDIYGRGKTKNPAIEQQFKRSNELKSALDWVKRQYLNPRPKHRASIQELCREENKEYTIDGLIGLLVSVRGNLHHYSSRSSKRQGTPFNQKDFESIAFLAFQLSFSAIAHRESEIGEETYVHDRPGR